MKIERMFLYLLAGWMLVAAGCSKETGSEQALDNISAPAQTDGEKINKFIVECMQEIYLWESLTDWETYAAEATYKAYSGEHYALFNELLYEDDRWSMLTEDIDGLGSSLQGVSTTYGYVLIFGQFANNADAYFAIILYVYPGTPAEKAGLKRGDLIVRLNGGNITRSNYTDLYDAPSIAIQLGRVAEGSVTAESASVEMVAVEMYENPVNTVRVIEDSGRRIGYLCYTDYVAASEPELLDVFRGFQQAGVTDVVLDLRYNGGGLATTARFLSSILVPRTAAKNKEVYLTQKWNDLYERYFKANGRDNNEYFIDTLPVNMNLERLYVLTTGNTASASEATIIGLRPYMDVVLAGEATHGKYYGGYVLSVDDYYEGSSGYSKAKYKDISNWGVYAMTYRYANKDNYPDFSGGLSPDGALLAEEDYMALKPFGDVSYPLLQKALERITGKRDEASLSRTSPSPPYTIFPEMSRRRDPSKRNMIHRRPLPKPGR